MQVRSWMTHDVETVHPGDDVESVRARFARRNVRQFPVVAVGRLVGMVTERDLRNADPFAPVKRFMRRSPVTTTPSAAIEEAAAVVREHHLTALPVVEGETLVGILSESDLLAALIELCGVVEPTTVVEVECEENPQAVRRIRQVLEQRGATVPWMSAVPTEPGRQRVTVRVRMPIGRVPESILEEAGFPVRWTISGRAAAERDASTLQRCDA